MNEDGSRKKNLIRNLKDEWNLFWGSFTEDKTVEVVDPFAKNPELAEHFESISLDQVKTMNRGLSAERRKLNQRLESLKKEIDLNSAKLEALKLVGGDFAETEAKISELTDFGQTLNDQLTKVDTKLKFARSFEDQIKKSSLQEL